jgi:hypothetical protein
MENGATQYWYCVEFSAHYFQALFNLSWVMESRRMRLTGYVAHMGEKRNTCKP